MISFQIPGETVPWARSGQSGKRHFTPMKQTHFMGVVKLFAGRAMAGQEPFDGALCLRVRAVYLKPVSWSQKRKDATKWKTSKPDNSNIVKLIEDAMNKVVWLDDAQVADLQVQKIYGDTASLTVSVTRLD